MSTLKPPARYGLYPALRRFPDRTYSIISPGYLRASYDDENHASVQIVLDFRLESPFSVLPRALHTTKEIEFRPIFGSNMIWRGISCQIGYITLQVRADNLAGARVIDGLFRVLLPDADPPGLSIQHLLVGVDYFESKNATIHFSFDDIFDKALNYLPCGYLEAR